MAEAAVSLAVETLGKLLIEKAVFLKSVKGEVEWVRDELKRMQCFLKDAAKKQSDNESIRNWISDIRKVAHDAEDVIEMFVLNVQNKGLTEMCACFLNHMYHLNAVGEEIQSIRKRLDAIEDSRRRYGIEGVESSARTRSQEEVETRRRLADWINDKHLVGLEKDVEILLENAIFEKSKKLSVAAILGMGGIGKSTLARKIYNYPQIVGQFQFRAWVVVSSEFTPEDIMKQILLKVGISLEELKRLEYMDDRLRRQEELKKEVNKRLTGKRYFIVLDDVWEASHWESLSSAFPDGDNGSRLLLTSRNQVISTNTGYVHNMKLLDADQSSQLLWRKAVVDNSNCNFPDDLKYIAEEILKRCGGLPLAISVVGGLLARKTRSKSEWDRVLREMKSHLDRMRGDISAVSAILELSYQNLPLELKACFLCLGFFKEDAIIEAEQLVHIWVALGLVAKEVVGEEERMEDVARDYLNDLISRNMVQVNKIKYEKVRNCHVHDLLRDLCIRKAEEEIDFEVIREEGNSNQSLDKPRHRAIYLRRLKFIFSTDQNQHLRSLFVHTGEEELQTKGGPSWYWKRLELLRVLYLGDNIKVRRGLPKSMGVLIGLRYLKMRSTKGIFKMPRSWGELKNLEVLDFRESVGFIILDKVVLRMKKLRHIYAKIWRSEVGLGNIRNLETLNKIWLKDSNLWQIEELVGASKLYFRMDDVRDRKDQLSTYLRKLENLECLSIKYYDGRYIKGLANLHRLSQLKLVGLGSIRELPEFPPNLSYLSLACDNMPENSMLVLEKLPKLIHLKVRALRFLDETVVVSPQGFPMLKVLHLWIGPKVPVVEIGEGAMPELNQFIIENCPDLNVENLPNHIKSAITYIQTGFTYISGFTYKTALIYVD